MSIIRLIASAAFVGQELAAEFGRIPPAFLPVGVSRLFEQQVSRFGGGPVFLTIPESFTPQPHDLKLLHALQVTLLPLPDGLRLGESIAYALNLIAAPAWPVRLLHGDTLIHDLPSEGEHDVIATCEETDDYSWATLDLAGDRVTQIKTIEAGEDAPEGWAVACGYFSFSSSSLITRALTRARGDFIKGLDFYAQERAVRAVPVLKWYDFGHVQTYFRSRRAISTARFFNTLRMGAHSVRKSSPDREKIEAEAQWFAALPPEAKPFSARLLRCGEMDGAAFYETDYQHAPTLSELLVFGALGRPTWRKILRSCHEFLRICAHAGDGGSGDAALADLVRSKTTDRLARYAR